MKSLLLILAMTLQMQVDSLYDLSYEYEDQGNFAEAIRLNKEALSLTPDDSLEWVSIFCNRISLECFCIGDYESAAAYGYQALSADEANNDSVGLSSSLNQLSAVMLQMGQTDDAIAMAERAVAIEQSLQQSGSEGDRTAVLSDRLGVLSEILSKAGQHERAIDCSLRAVDLARQTGDPRKLGTRLSQLGTAYTHAKQYHEAIPVLEEALALLKEQGQVRSEIMTLVPYSQALDESGRRSEAIAAMERCVDLTYRTGMRDTRLHALHELALMHQSKVSRPYFDHFTSLRDSIYTDKMQERISDWEVRYETEKKEQEIREQHRALRQQRLALAATILLVILLLVAVLLINRKRRRAKLLAEEKNRMVSILSHDLKSPAMAQQHALRQIEQGKVAPDHAMLRALVQSQDAQVSLVLNMLDYARLEAGKVEVQPITLDLSDVAQDVMAILAQQAADRQIRLTADSHSVVLKTDRTMITTIMRNLVSNAIRYSPVGSDVEIHLLPNGFEVVDHGVGFGGESAEKGTGLGLTICRRFARLCHATLTIRPTSPQGTTVRLEF